MIHYLYLLRAMVGSIYSAVGLLRRRNTRTGHHSSLLLNTVANRSKPLPFGSSLLNFKLPTLLLIHVLDRTVNLTFPVYYWNHQLPCLSIDSIYRKTVGMSVSKKMLVVLLKTQCTLPMQSTSQRLFVGKRKAVRSKKGGYLSQLEQRMDCCTHYLEHLRYTSLGPEQRGIASVPS
jgi:hypothetical protein